MPQPPATAPDLVRGLQAGRRDAFERLYGDYNAAIYNLCARVLGDREEARDVTQEVFIKAFNQLPATDAESFGAAPLALPRGHQRLLQPPALAPQARWRRRRRSRADRVGGRRVRARPDGGARRAVTRPAERALPHRPCAQGPPGPAARGDRRGDGDLAPDGRRARASGARFVQGGVREARRLGRCRPGRARPRAPAAERAGGAAGHAAAACAFRAGTRACTPRDPGGRRPRRRRATRPRSAPRSRPRWRSARLPRPS